MKRIFAASLPLLLALGTYAATFTPGNLVVVRVGTGAVALNNQSTATFLDEYTPAGVYVQTITLPTAASGGSAALTLQGTSTSEGFLEFCPNAPYLTLGGYNVAPGTATPGTVAASTINRVVGRVDMSGNVDTTTAINTGTSGNIRSVTSDNGLQFWVSSSSASVGYVSALGASSALQLSATAPTNIRVTRDVNGQLYITSASGTFLGLGTLGSGLPTTAGQTPSLLNGFPTTTGPSPYDFFLSGNDAWVADDRTTGAGGIQHWTLSGGLWSLSYTLAPSGTTGVRGLAVDLSGTSPILFGTTTDNKIVEFVDTGSGATPTFILTGASNTALRGLVLIPVPEPTTVALLGLGLLGVLCFRRR
jgi:hypothetical protein